MPGTLSRKTLLTLPLALTVQVYKERGECCKLQIFVSQCRYAVYCDLKGIERCPSGIEKYHDTTGLTVKYPTQYVGGLQQYTINYLKGASGVQGPLYADVP